MNYYFTDNYPDELYHFGVKGMKWGIRKQRPIGTGRRRTSWSQASQMAKQANASRRQSWKRSNVQSLTPRERKIRRRTRVAQGALIAGGAAMMAYSVYRIKSDPVMSSYVSKGMSRAKRMMSQGSRYSSQARLMLPG